MDLELSLRRWGAAAFGGFDFAGGVLPAGVTLTRASAGSWTDAGGVLRSAGSNAARLGHRLSGGLWVPAGLLAEPARTNAIRNNTMQGAVAGTPGTLPTHWSASAAGLSLQLIGAASENGIACLDYRVWGTPASNSFVNVIPDVAAAAAGQQWVGSFWARLVAGSVAANPASIEMRESSSGAFLVNTVTPIALTGTLTRFQQARTLSHGSANQISVRLITAFSTGVALDFTLRIGLPQLEQVASGPPLASAPVATSGSADSRAADAVTLDWGSRGVADGTHTIRYTLDDGSTQDVAANVSGGMAALPATLNRLAVRRAVAL